MGLDKNGVRFLLMAKSLGADFSKTAMIGRQKLDLSIGELKAGFKQFAPRTDPGELGRIFSDSRYAEPLLEILGAKKIDSFDASEYESATIVSDFNHGISETFFNRYSLVIDAGTLEHIFNFPQALKNCMNMVGPDGHFLSITPCNNFCGHGFYQFSPELFFSVFTKANGFSKPLVYAAELGQKFSWYEVKSPDELKQRVTLRNHNPVYLMVLSQKTAKKEILKVFPQQSDYLRTWKTVASNVKSELFDLAQRLIPTALKVRLLKLLKRFPEKFDSRFFKKLNE